MPKVALSIVLFLVSGLPGPNALAQKSPPKPVMSKQSLTPEQITIYRAVLFHYTKGDPVPLALASRTEPFSRQFEETAVCMGDVLLPEPDAIPIVHRIDPAVALSDRMTIVNAHQGETVEESDGGSPIQGGNESHKPSTGQASENFVMPPNATDLFTFTEIIFNKEHTRAAVQNSSVCGGLCGVGGTLVFTVEDGEWKLNSVCSGWIS